MKAEVKKIESYSGHGDYREMIGFLDCQDKSALEKTFLVHGEYETQKKYVELLPALDLRISKFLQEVRSTRFEISS